MDELWTGVLFIIFGLWVFLFPKSALNMKIKWAKLFGAKLTVSKKTETFYKYVGIVAIVVGLIFLLR